MKSNTAKPEILVLYYYYAPNPMRQNTCDHLFSFDAASYGNVIFWNTCFALPDHLRTKHYDLVLFHVTFCCSLIWGGASYAQKVAYVDFLKDSTARKVMLTQDEFCRTDQLSRFINEFHIWGVFSVAPASEWSKIYRDVDTSKINFFMVLTGYLSPDVSQKIKNLESEGIQRIINIGYRAWKSQYWVGRHGYLKGLIADVIRDEAAVKGLESIDISTEAKDTFYGLDWYRFLLKCKYMIGVEGGSSLLDYDGSIQQTISKYLMKYPKASFTDCESACFAGLDGNLNLFAISPRHLEACATKTCQILVEGDYNGVLEPWKHYIPLKKDLSNIHEVLEIVKDDSLRETIVDNAYRDIVESGRYSYDHFVREVYQKSLEGISSNSVSRSATSFWKEKWIKLLEKGSRKLVPYSSRLRSFLKR